jgi:uncharacterized protein (DUF983 family)
MKTQSSICHRARSSRSGSAVLVILILLAIMVMFVMGNTATVNWLRRQVILVDKHQTQRLTLASTNQVRNGQSVTNQPTSK